MARFTPVSTSPVPERAVLVGIEQRGSSWPVDRSLDELERLADTAGAECVARVTQRLERPNPRTFIGSGKVAEVCGLVSRLDADVVIFDDDLSPSQQANLEKAVGEPVKIIDRTALILDIFGLHAQTREGRLQVQLAQLQYLLPRLRGMWSHLASRRAVALEAVLDREKASSKSIDAWFATALLRFDASLPWLSVEGPCNRRSESLLPRSASLLRAIPTLVNLRFLTD